jgi:hypothetical protein
VNAAAVTAYVGLAAIEGALVALPCPTALERLGRLRSPLWTLVPPGAIVVGTFGVLALPSLATGLAMLAAIATPLLAAIAVVAVVHGRHRRLLVVPMALGVAAVLGSGWLGQLATSLLVALGCLTLGAALAWLTPGRWLHLAVLSMGAVDVLLLVLGVGQPSATLLHHAMANGPLPVFHRAELGPMSKDYPDLVLAAVLGGIVAGRPIQRRTAMLVGILAAAYGGLFLVAQMLPATVPLAAGEIPDVVRVREQRAGQGREEPCIAGVVGQLPAVTRDEGVGAVPHGGVELLDVALDADAGSVVREGVVRVAHGAGARVDPVDRPRVGPPALDAVEEMAVGRVDHGRSRPLAARAHPAFGDSARLSGAERALVLRRQAGIVRADDGGRGPGGVASDRQLPPSTSAPATRC